MLLSIIAQLVTDRGKATFLLLLQHFSHFRYQVLSSQNFPHILNDASYRFIAPATGQGTVSRPQYSPDGPVTKGVNEEQKQSTTIQSQVHLYQFIACYMFRL